MVVCKKTTYFIFSKNKHIFYLQFFILYFFYFSLFFIFPLFWWTGYQPTLSTGWAASPDGWQPRPIWAGLPAQINQGQAGHKARPSRPSGEWIISLPAHARRWSTVWWTSYLLIPLGRGGRGGSSSHCGVENGGLWWPEWASEARRCYFAVPVMASATVAWRMIEMPELRGLFLVVMRWIWVVEWWLLEERKRRRYAWF